MIYSEECASKLLVLRKEKNLSQEQIGKIIKLSKQAVNEIEKGRTRISLENACLLADFYGVSVDYLVGRTNIEEIPQNYNKKELTEQEELMLNNFRNLDDISKGKLIERSKVLLEESRNLEYKTNINA